MKVRIPVSVLAFAALLTLAAPVAFAAAQTRTNPPSACDPVTKTCSCEEPSTVGAKCIKVNLDMGRTTPWTGSRPCSLKVFADDQSPMVFTPESLFAVAGGYTFKRIGNRLLPDGATPRDVVLSHPNGESVTFAFNAGESVARPDPGVHVKMDERLQMTDAAGWACTNSPVYYDLYETDGTVRRFLATDRTGERGKLVSVTDSRGVRHTAADMGVDVVYGPDGVRQFLTPSRLADVRVAEDGYDVDVYALDAVPLKGADGLYALPARAPDKRLSVRGENGGNRARLVFRDGGERTYLFDWVRGDWSLTRPSGTREVRTRSIVDSKAAQTTHEVRSRAGGLLSRDEYNYVWKSWGFAATNHVEGFGGVVRTTEWTYFTSGGGKGQVRTELKSSGLWTEYAYDAEGRVVSVKRSGPDMMTELVTCSYASVDPSDVVPPVDSRPRTVVKTLDGVECERTYYVYSSLTDVVERVGVQGAPYGGTNALRTVTAYYPVVAGDVRSGRIRSVRREDGRLDLYDYALATNVWTETVTHLHEQSPDPVSGKTTREIRMTNARGEVVEDRTEAFIDGAWHTIARNRMAYNPEGKRVRTEDLAGRVTTTEWDCCHKVAETRPDGSATAWDYDDEGRLVAASRLIPLDLTNVTWLTTCYAYDDLGRQTAVWTTNFAAHVGLPATRTRYDALGRVLSRIDALGNETETVYDADGRASVRVNPNASTLITARNAAGVILSVAGTAVTPEFRTYGVLPDGTRWTRTVQGKRVSSPRFTKRYENMLGEIVREERSGFRGAVLATVNAYDFYGRLVCIASDGEPTREFAYDILGNRSATMTSVGSRVPRDRMGEWRKSKSFTGYTVLDGAVWQTQTNVTSCSDAAIAPLVTSQSLQLTGLTPATPARTGMTDIRGNVTESWTEQADGITTAKRRVPEATNIISSRSRFGVELESVSVSAVTNTTVYDALGRVSASIDGRGNATRTEYDPFGRRSATIDAAGNSTRYAYDRFGNLAAVTNALGNAIVYEYDLRGRKTYEGGATYPVRYTYDVFGNKETMMTYCESHRDASGKFTHWFYDEASGAMTNKVYADGKGPRYDYDANGRLAKRTWARGIDTFYAYDGWGNLTNTTYSDNTPTVAIKYDALGRQVEAHDAAGVTTFAYDAFGANTNETVVGVAGTNVLERFTDAYGRDIGYALNGERRTIIGRNPGTGRIETMHAAGCTNAFRWTYQPGCDLKHTLLYPNGALVTWEYEPRRDLTTLVSNDVYSAFRYTYNDIGKRISKNDERYGYNIRGEVILATNIVTGAEFAYRYDDNGNRTWSREFGTNCTYVANELNQYTNIVRGGTIELPSFDLDGNQTNIVSSTGEWVVTYNGENRPVRWHRVADDTVIRMAYDRMGRRVAKNEEVFIYDNYLNICGTIWDPTEKYLSRALLGFPNKACDALLFHDGNQNVVSVIRKHGGQVSWGMSSYSPFGLMIGNEMGCQTRLPGFSSELTDREIGLTYYNFRHYNPTEGRWCSRDPKGCPISLLYLMVENDPLNHTDLLGLEPDAKGLCEQGKTLAEGSSQYNEIIKKLVKKHCSVDVECDCCNAGSGRYGEAGGDSAKDRKIKLCTDGANKTATDYRQTYIHELIHALDHCLKNKDKFSCDEKICTEIKAYSEDGSCRDGGAYRLPGETERACIERGALNSVLDRVECKGKDERTLRDKIAARFVFCVSKEVRDRTNGQK